MIKGLDFMNKRVKIFFIMFIMILFVILFPSKIEAKTQYDNITFNGEYYLNNYSDLRNAFGNNYGAAYNHFITCGIKEGRQGSPFFDVIFYLENNSDLRNAFGNNYEAAYNHFITCGIKEGRQGSLCLDINYYLNYYEDLRNAFKGNYRRKRN